MPGYYGGNDTQKYAEMAIPVILVILVLAVAGVKMFGLEIPIISDLLGGDEAIQTLIITNDMDVDGARQFGQDISSRVTKINPNVDSNVMQHLKAGYITSNKYDMVILYGDNTALTYDARKEIAAYVNGGGSLMIVKGAGLKGLNVDGSESEYVFGWDVEDLSPLIKFKPDCPMVGNCDEIALITVTPDQMSDVTMTPTDWDHPMIKRMGLNSPISIDLSKYATFSGVMLVQDSQNNKVAWLDWRDANGKPHSAPAVIGYDTGATGGRIVYISYNPIELNQEELFRNMIQWLVKQ